jgi:hypothetical protein
MGQGQGQGQGRRRGQAEAELAEHQRDYWTTNVTEACSEVQEQFVLSSSEASEWAQWSCPMK